MSNNVKAMEFLKQLYADYVALRSTLSLSSFEILGYTLNINNGPPSDLLSVEKSWWLNLWQSIYIIESFRKSKLIYVKGAANILIYAI